MRVEHWEYEYPPVEGKLDPEAKIMIERGVRAQGIYIPELGLVRSKSDVENPWWVMISTGKIDGIIRVITCYFESEQEMNLWLDRGVMYADSAKYGRQP
jgi:hypothetical protein